MHQLLPEPESPPAEESEPESPPSEDDLNPSEPEPVAPRRSGRISRRPNYWGFPERARTVMETLSPPTTYQQARTSAQAVKWDTAMKDEMKALEKNNTFTIVPRASNQRVIDCKWVYRVKELSDGTIE